MGTLLLEEHEENLVSRRYINGESMRSLKTMVELGVDEVPGAAATLAAPNVRRINNPTLHRIWRQSGVPRQFWRQPCHAFRKAFISNLVGAGVHEHLVKALVGHARGVTGDLYTDMAVIMDRLRDAVAHVPAIGAMDGRVVPLRPATGDHRSPP